MLKNIVPGVDTETFYAVPRKGWKFDHWENYCIDGSSGNQCSFVINGIYPAGALPLIAVFSLDGLIEQGPPSRSFVVDLGDLERTRQAYLAGHPETVKQVGRVIYSANRYLLVTPVSVVSSELVAPSGDIHDYVDYKAYWWPNPDTADGLPWIRRDGHINKDNFVDFASLQLLSSWTEALSLAWYLTRDEVYAAKVGDLLRTWFTDPATYMNPSNKYSQMEPHWEVGDYNVAGLGNRFPTIFDAAGLIESSTSWSADDKIALQKWSHDFIEWVKVDPIADKQLREPSNHGTNYDFLYTLLSLYSEDYVDARVGAEHYFYNRMPGQIAQDGSNPYEMLRSNNLLYHRYNLGRAMDLAQLTRHIPDFDGINYTTADGRGIKLATEYLMPYMTGEKIWEQFPGEIWPTEPNQYYHVMLRATHLYNSADFYKGALDTGYYLLNFTAISYPRFTITINGDLNGDRKVDVNDDILIMSQIGTCATDLTYYKAADLNADGCINEFDYITWLAESKTDSDADGISKFSDNCPMVANPDQTDTDIDGVGDLCDVFPVDPMESLDTDVDSIGDNADNCPLTANPNQSDSGGVDTKSADGIGDACQCGDISGDGKISNTDSVLIKRHLLGLPSNFNADFCDVNGDALCTNTDAVLIQRTLLGLPPGIIQSCKAAGN